MVVARSTLRSESAELVLNAKRQYRLATGDDVFKVVRQVIRQFWESS